MSVTEPTASMLGTFNLRDTTDLATFKADFDALCTHLVDVGMLLSWRLLERAYHDGFDAAFPETHLVIEMRFRDHETAQKTWDHFASHKPPISALHGAVTRQVKDAHFALCHEVS
ncbi:MAG: DUF6614 family protein [Pseudomonadota bacterium]